MKCRELDSFDDVASQLLAQYISSKGKYTVSPIAFWILEILEEKGPIKKDDFVHVILSENPNLKYAWVTSYERLIRQGMITENDGKVSITDFGKKVLDDCRENLEKYSGQSTEILFSESCNRNLYKAPTPDNEQVKRCQGYGKLQTDSFAWETFTSEETAAGSVLPKAFSRLTSTQKIFSSTMK